MYVYGQRTVSHVCTLVRNLVRGGGGGNLKQINTKSDSRVMLTKHFRLIRAKVIEIEMYPKGLNSFFSIQLICLKMDVFLNVCHYVSLFLIFEFSF